MKMIVIWARFYYYSVFTRFSMKSTYNQQFIKSLYYFIIVPVNQMLGNIEMNSKWTKDLKVQEKLYNLV